MSNKNLYDKPSKEKKIPDKYNFSQKEIVIKKSSSLIKLLSFLFVIISKVFKVIAYLIIIGLCSLGATYLVNNILHLKMF